MSGGGVEGSAEGDIGSPAEVREVACGGVECERAAVVSKRHVQH